MERRQFRRRRGSPPGISRRTFLGAGAAAGASLLTGGWWGCGGETVRTIGGQATWLEATIPELQAQMASGKLTSQDLTRIYLRQVDELNPLLGAVIETNPNAISIAAGLDNERRGGHVRGPLHGIPVFVKDNIATNDSMQTTAGSLALVNSRVPADAPIVSKLRAAGAVILGKTNLTEWANFRGGSDPYWAINGWSARGGFTRDPYVLDLDPCGSSTGSAVAAAANMCAAAVGTETDGSIVCPAGQSLIVGLKPTVGLIAQGGIIPIGHSQDTAGPLARTVTDVAILLGVLQSPFGEVAGHQLPTDYTKFLQRGALHGARIGVDRQYFTPDLGGDPEIAALVEQALSVMRDLGATVVDTNTGDLFGYYDAEFTVLLYEFKVQIAEYLAGLQDTSMRTLADLIAFNVAHCPEEMKYFGQEVFELAETTSGDLSDSEYLDARALCVQLARAEGIDAALQRDQLDAIVAPSAGWGPVPAAVAGYPNLAVPVGLRADGKPAGMYMYGGFLHEPELLAFAYDLEQEIQPRSVPQFLSEVPPEPPDAGICASLPTTSRGVAEKTKLVRHLGTGRRWCRCL